MTTLVLLLLHTSALAAGDQLAGVTVGAALPVVTGWTNTSEGSLTRPGKYAGLSGALEVRTYASGLVRMVSFSANQDVFDALSAALRADGWAASKGDPLFSGARSLNLQKGPVTRTLSGNGSVTVLSSRDDRVCE